MGSKLKGYLVLDLEVKDVSEFMDYVKRVPVFLNKHKGKYIVEGVIPEIVEGDWSPERMVILEFETTENAREFLADPEVQALFEIRKRASESKLILLEGGSWKDEREQ